MNLEETCAYESRGKEYDAGNQLEWLGCVTKVVGCEQQDGGGGNESYYGWAKSGEDGCDDCGLAVLEQHLADGKHEQEGQPQHAERCQYGTQHSHPLRVAFVDDSGVAGIGGAVDAYRSWSGLADGHDVGKFGRGKPVVLLNHLVVDERQHGVPSSEVEYAYLCEYYEET